MKRFSISVVVVMLIASAGSFPFVLNAGFGQAPSGDGLDAVQRSPNYRDGEFRNAVPASASRSAANWPRCGAL